MARLPRADQPGSWHHVINRGIAKRPLFEKRDDMRFFLARLVRQVRLGRIELHAFCLLNTHFHLLVRSPKGELSEAMRRAQNEHSRRFNRRNRRDGALIRGRFFSRPVDSEEYQSTLVRYIDANPVTAGIVSSSGEYEFGSARAYLGASDPSWLSRTWIEAEACRVSGSERFSRAAYHAAFGESDALELQELSDFVETRVARMGEKGPLDDLISAAPHHVRSWMQRNARLADGHRLGLPVCGQRALRRALDEHIAEVGVWMIEDGRRTWRGMELAWIGLLRELCGFSWKEIAGVDQGSISRVRRMGAIHRRLIQADPAYLRRAARVSHAAIERCLGGGRR